MEEQARHDWKQFWNEANQSFIDHNVFALCVYIWLGDIKLQMFETGIMSCLLWTV